MPDSNHRDQPNGGAPQAPRAVALVGPQGSGKSAVFDALLHAAGATPRRGTARGLGTEIRLGHCTWMGDPWTLLDCPGSIEFAHEAACALAVADLALVVCEAAPARAATLRPLFDLLEQRRIPAVVLVNKIDTLTGRVRHTLAALQAETPRKLVLRQVPIRGDGRDGEAVMGYVDVISARAYRYRRGEPSVRMDLPTPMRAREAEARAVLLETLADHDDTVLEKVLEDLVPEPHEIYRPLHETEASAAVASVLLGAAEAGHGMRRLWKALRHDVPGPADTAARLGIPSAGDPSATPPGTPLAQVFRTVHAGHAGRLSFARIWRGPVKDGGTLGGIRIGGIHQFPGSEARKVPEAVTGDVVALGRMEGVATGDWLGAAPDADAVLPFPVPPPPVHALAIALGDRKDEVRLSAALQRLVEGDGALTVTMDAELAQTVIAGQGELHLRTALERLAATSGVAVTTTRPRIAHRETIRRAVTEHARLKRQTGGHGQFADVTLEIVPLPRGSGFSFAERVVGGAVPKRFIPAVEEGAITAARQGPLGHPVVDIQVTLLDGGFHSVDSSDLAFATAARQALQAGLARAEPVLLEPVDLVTVSVPATHTAAAQRLLSGRRGQILGHSERPGNGGWDEVTALVPAAELHGLIIELRSQTQGLGTYLHRFDHLAEARGR